MSDDSMSLERLEQVARVAHWLATEYGDEIGDGPPGYWQFQARELLTVVRGEIGQALEDERERVLSVRRALIEDESCACENCIREELGGKP